MFIKLLKIVSQNMDDKGSEWKVANGRKSGRPKRARPTSKDVILTSTTTTISPTDLEFLAARIRELSQEILSLRFYRDLKSGLKKWLLSNTTSHNEVMEIVAYGIGRPTISTVSQIQLAVLFLLKSDILISDHSVSSYEPSADVSDLKLFELLGIHNLRTNEECRRSVCPSGPTLFFMPHCAHRMYSNVLWANWKYECMRDVAILGNSFDKYSMGLRKEDPSDCVAAVSSSSSFTEEIVLPFPLLKEDDCVEEYFNDSSGTLSFQVQQVYKAFSDTSLMFFLNAAEMNKMGVFESVPPIESSAEATTMWDQELIRADATTVQVTEEEDLIETKS